MRRHQDQEIPTKDEAKQVVEKTIALFNSDRSSDATTGSGLSVDAKEFLASEGEGSEGEGIM